MNSFVNFVLVFFAGLIIAMFSAALLVPRFIDWTNYKSLFEQQAARLVGRKVKVYGAVNLRLLPTPYLRFDDVRIGPREDQPWGADLLQAEAFTVWLSIPPLLRGVIEIREITLTQPKLRIEIARDGAANWQGLGPRQSVSIQEAGRFKLDELNIIDGEITVHRALGSQAVKASDEKALIAAKAISGVFSARTLYGPYKFFGQLQIGDMDQRLQVATGRVGSDKTMVLRAVMEAVTGANKTTLRGKLTTGAAPTFVGELRTISAVRRAETLTSGRGIPKIEFRATLTAGLNKAKFSPAALSFLHHQRPAQSLLGRIVFDWTDRVQADAYFSSKVLDLAHLRETGTGQEQGKAGRGKPGMEENLFHVIMGPIAHLTQRVDEGHFEAEVTQINLGEEAIQDFRLEAVRGPQGLLIKRFETELPGHNKVRLQGLYGGKGPRDFAGQIELYGDNAERMAGWIIPAAAKRLSKRPHRFAFRADVTQSADRVMIANGRGEIGGAPFRLDLTYYRDAHGRSAAPVTPSQPDGWRMVGGKEQQKSSAETIGPNRPRLQLRLHLSSLNLEKLAGGTVTTADLRNWVLSATRLRQSEQEGRGKVGREAADRTKITKTVEGSGQGQSPLAKRMAWLAQLSGLAHTNIDLDLTAARFQLSDFRGIDLILRLSMAKHSYRVVQLAFQSHGALALSVAATGQRLARPKLNFTAQLQAQYQADLADGLKLLGLSSPLEASQVEKFLPLRLAIDGHLGGAGTKARGGGYGSRLSIDGGLNKSHFKLDVRSENANLFSGHWRQKPLVLTAALDNASGADLLQQLFPRLTGVPLQRLARAPGYVQITASGIPAQSMQAHGDLKTHISQARVSGRASLSEDGLSFTGRASLTGTDTALLYGLVGATPPPTLPETGFAFAGDLQKAGPRYGFTKIDGRIGQTRISGQTELNLGANGPVQLALEATAETVVLPDLLAGLVAWQAPPIASALGSAATASRWPAHPVNLAMFNRFEGSVKLTTPALLLAPELTAKAAVLEAKLSKGKIALQVSAADFFDGKLQLAAELTRRGQQVELAGRLRLDEARLEALPGGGLIPGSAETRPLATGNFALNADFAATGVSPNGLAAELNGAGRLVLSPGAIHRFSTAAARTALQDINSGKAQPTEFGGRFRARLHSEDLIFARQQIPFTISGGVIRFDPITLRDETGRVTITSYISLPTLYLDSEWRLQTGASPAAPSAQALPPVKIVFAGPLADFGRIEPVVDTRPLERFLQVVKLKKDVEKLEQLEQQIEQLKEQKKQLREEAEQRALQNWSTEVSPAP